MLFIILVYEVLLNRAGLEQIDRLTVREGIRERRDPPVGIDGQEPWLLLRVLGYVDLGEVIRNAELLEGNGNLDSVGSLGGVEVDAGACAGHGDLR